MERLGIFPLEVCGCKTVNFSFHQVNLGVPSVASRVFCKYHRIIVRHAESVRTIYFTDY